VLLDNGTHIPFFWNAAEICSDFRTSGYFDALEIDSIIKYWLEHPETKHLYESGKRVLLPCTAAQILEVGKEENDKFKFHACDVVGAFKEMCGNVDLRKAKLVNMFFLHCVFL
jgi:hypothetical protein